MKYFIVAIFLLPNVAHAQSKLVGLGRYTIGVTTPDSLSSVDFKEQEQAYVKGTLTLPCTHIRSFTSSALEVAGILTVNLSLFFYDNKLFKLTCDYSDELNTSFRAKYGDATSRMTRHVQVCGQHRNDPMVLRNKAWQNADIEALVVHGKGLNADCQMQEVARLMISSKTISALASDCDLQNVEPLIEEFDKILNDHQDQQGQSERRRVKKIKK